MSKSSCKSLNQTINFAKKCVNSTSAIQQLVYEPSPGACPKHPHSFKEATPVKCPYVKHIKVCTGAEMKKKCLQSKICAQPVLTPKSPGEKFASLLLFGLKAAFAGSLVYLTYEMGLWGSSESTEEIWKEICKLFGFDKGKSVKELSRTCNAERELGKMSKPGFPSRCSAVMDTERAIYNLQDAWNKMIINIVWFLVKGPGELLDYLEKKSDKPPEETAPKCTT